MEADLTRSLNLVEAIHYVLLSWDTIDQSLIRKCWLHCGIVNAPMSAQLRDEIDYKRNEIDSEMDELSDLMAQSTIQGSASELLDLESNVTVHDECTDVDNDEGSSSDSDAVEPEPVKASEALKCCLTLSAFLLEAEEDTSDDIRMLNSVVAKVRSLSIQKRKQKSMTDFFVLTL